MQTKKYKLYLKKSPHGLNYLGKTERDPFKYIGSGKYWLRHIKKYQLKNSDIKTEILFECDDKVEFKKVSLYYSKLFDIVNSKEFANIVNEEGDGGKTITKETHPLVFLKTSEGLKKYWDKNEERKNILSNKMKNDNPMGYKKYREKVKNSLLGHEVSKETKYKISDSLKNYFKENENPFKGKTHSDETKKILSEKRGIPIIIDNVKYRSLRHASKELNKSRYLIKKSLQI